MYDVSSGPIWSRPAPGERRASLTREQLAAAATALVDEHGVAALSMRRLAQELGVGTMTLYHYVRTKDDLLALIDDAIMGELLVDEADLPPDDWRRGLTAIATRAIEVHRRHPWVITALGRVGRLGPNAIRHFEQTLAAVAGTGSSAEERLEIATLVDEYVFGHALRMTTGPREDDAELMAFVEGQLKEGDFPHLRALIYGEGGREAAWERFAAVDRDPDRFARGLDRLLDGIAAQLERRTA